MGKIKTLFRKLPKWNTPPPNRYLTLKEWLIYIIGGTGAMGASCLIQYITMSAGVYIAAALKINVDHIVYIGLVTSVITILTSPLISFIIDNTNSKYGKFRPYLIWLSIPITGCFFLLGQLASWITNYTAMLVCYTIVFNILNFLNRIYSLSFNSIVQVLSPSMEERTTLMSIGTFFTSLGPTIVHMLFPAIANYMYSQNGVSGVNTLKAIKWMLPIMAIGFFALGLILAFGVKERIVVPKKFKSRQKFTEGIKKTFKNKYFWITNISGILGNFRIVATSFTVWIILYMIFPSLVAKGKQDAANLMQTILVTIIGDACVPGMLFAPFFIKKFGKKKIVLFTNIACIIATVPMLFLRNAYALLFMIYLVTLFNGLQIVTGPAIQAEIYDYQQYKTGDRLEGFISQFGAMLLTIFGMGFTLVAPAVYKHFGFINDNNVLYDNSVLLNIIKIMCALGVGSGILATIPYFFYDLNEKRHHQIMDILTVRAKFEDGYCDEETKNLLEKRIEEGEKGVLENI